MLLRTRRRAGARVGENVPIPYNHTLEKAVIPNAGDVVAAVRKMFGK